MSASRSENSALSHLRHDLRTPLNQIIGFSELLLEEVNDAGHKGYIDDLEKIRAAGKTLLNLINENLTDERVTLAGEIIETGPVTASPFVASAPAEPATPAAPTVPPPAAPAGATGRILVVDDLPDNRDVLIRQLERQGHAVITAADGRSALDLVRREPCDVVLLDMMMPVLDGYGTLCELKSDAALRHLPVIMISALDELGSVVRCIERGAEDYLPKPFNPTLLRARIGAALEKKRFRDQERTYIQTIEETQKRLNAELAEAENYVRSILPAPLTSGPVRADWRLVPSTELGGDSFGYHWIDPEHFAVYLLDVCGHGVGAALLSVTAINVLRNGSLPGIDFRDPGAVLTALNEAFLMEKQNGMYFTIWYGVWHPATRRLRFASAGHPPALLVTPAGSGVRRVEPLRGPGMLLGGMSGIEYKTLEHTIVPGARLYVVSDGTFEITRPDGTLWGLKGLSLFCADPALETPGGADLDRLLTHARSLRGPGPLDDDFSLVRLVLH